MFSSGLFKKVFLAPTHNKACYLTELFLLLDNLVWHYAQYLKLNLFLYTTKTFISLK